MDNGRYRWITIVQQSRTMYADEDNSTDLIGAFCELLFPRKGHRNGIIVDDYGNEWLVQLTNGKEVPVYKDEVFII